MTTERTEAEVLEIAAAQAEVRRAANAERVASLEPESVSDVLRGRLGRQVAKQAERRGQLNVDGASGTP